MLYKLIHKLSLMLSRIVKPGKVLVFCSYPDFSDNAYAVFHYIVGRGLFPDYKLVWIRQSGNSTLPSYVSMEIEKSKALVFPKRSLHALWYYYRARHVFMTHGLYSRLLVARPWTIVNLWHGMQVKRMGLLDHKGPEYMENSQIILATSEMFQKVMAEIFGKNPCNVIVLGLPRNDLMFDETDFYLRMGIDRSKYKSIGIWLPTYRSSTVGDIRVDGIYCEGSIAFLDASGLGELDLFLESHGILLLVKLHPMDKMQSYKFPIYKNIKVVKQSELLSPLYPLLGSTDFLLTDYSSVWVDYDILSKPMGFVMGDLDEYEKSRGFTLDNIERDSPGPIIKNKEQLFAFLSDPKSFYKPTGGRFNKYKDDRSTYRLLEFLKSKDLYD